MTYRKVPNLLTEEVLPRSFRDGIRQRPGTNADCSIAFSGMLVNEQVVIAPGHMQNTVKPLCFQKPGSSVSHIATYSHIGIAQQGKGNKLNSCQQRLKPDKRIQHTRASSSRVNRPKTNSVSVPIHELITGNPC